MSLESFKRSIELGRQGFNQGFSMGLPKLEELIGGITKSTMTLLFASSGQGKSSCVLYSYIYAPLKEHLEDNKLRIIFFALEMKEDFIIAKLLSTYLYDTYHIVVTAKQILSIGKDYILPDDLYEYVQLGYDWLEKVYKVLTIYEGSFNSDKLIKVTMEELKKEGEFIENKYIPKDPEKVILSVTDHVGLIQPSNGRNRKGEIDDYTNKLVIIRNKTGLSPIIVMQSNRAVANMERKKNEAFMEPMVEDIKETSTVSENSEIILAVYNPQVDKRTTYRGYQVKEMGYRFRSILVLKSRYGENQVADCCFFDGAVNKWMEMPKPEEIFDYSRYRATNNSSTDNIIENKDKNEKVKSKLDYSL